MVITPEELSLLLRLANTAEVERLTKANTDAYDTNTELMKIHHKLKKDYSDLRDDHNAMAASCTSYQEKIRQQDMTIKSLNRHISDLNIGIDIAVKAKQDLLTQVKDLQSRVDSFRGDH